MIQSPRPAESIAACSAGDEALALGALAWILSDDARGERLLALTGLSPADLRASLDAPATLAAVMAFLMAHEADLLACADALGVGGPVLAAAAVRLEGAV